MSNYNNTNSRAIRTPVPPYDAIKQELVEVKALVANYSTFTVRLDAPLNTIFLVYPKK